jgi:hypothetical protein
VLQAFFVAVTGGAEGDESLRDVRSDQARSILNEMRRLKPEDTPQRDDPWAGLYWEKPASSYLWQGTEGGRPRRKWQAALEQAKKEYRHAIELTGDDEGRALKVRAGLALACCLRCAVSDSPEEEIAARQAECPSDAVNCEVMRRGEYEGRDPDEKR